jgi:hypothetical protein
MRVTPLWCVGCCGAPATAADPVISCRHAHGSTDPAAGELPMSKGQRGNKEAKKPKKAPVPVPPGAALPGLIALQPDRLKRR